MKNIKTRNIEIVQCVFNDFAGEYSYRKTTIFILRLYVKFFEFIIIDYKYR